VYAVEQDFTKKQSIAVMDVADHMAAEDASPGIREPNSIVTRAHLINKIH